MDISERNRKVALSRWKNVRERERKRFLSLAEAAEERAALCGFIAGDGCIMVRKRRGRPRYDIGFYPDDERMLEVYLEFFSNVYGKEPTVVEKNEFYDVSIVSRSIGEDLCALAAFGTKEWDIPAFVLEDDENAVAWLRAFFSAEAYVTDKVVRVQTVNEEGMQQVSELLERFSIEHRQYVYEPAPETWSTVHIIIIFKESSRKRYAELIGFWHEKKSEALRQSLSLKAQT